MATTKDTERKSLSSLLSFSANSVQPAHSAVVHSPLAGACRLVILYSSNEIPQEKDTEQVTHTDASNRVFVTPLHMTLDLNPILITATKS